MSKFKVGDRVRAKSDCKNDMENGEGIIKSIDVCNGLIDKMRISITKKSKWYSVGGTTVNSNWHEYIELVSPEKELIETDMNIEDIKEFPNSVLVAAEKEAKKELAEDQLKIATIKFKELHAKIADKEREVKRVQKELTELRGKAAIAKPRAKKK